tara:strand:+ start:3773 stop:4102 length:330 start_codon:yes stop_codon:yes gene_type:complete
MHYLIKIAALILFLTASPSNGTAADAGVYLDAGCLDGICCLVLPNWDAGYFDVGIADTGRRRRVIKMPDAGEDTPDDGLSGCSASGASSLLWLLPLVAIRRRKVFLPKK